MVSTMVSSVKLNNILPCSSGTKRRNRPILQEAVLFHKLTWLHGDIYKSLSKGIFTRNCYFEGITSYWQLQDKEKLHQ